ncbi:Hypothetical predicted protein [Olea europaea subsp. europaea]|uniref:Uncharacterized protein n=1 Tax=Olea europaea subsp. europaea TaxID=158383 RepID=A0A8S0PJ11_OLEEU|nr:Hypothetical predicted protein [Olea europaea subsp. europaea]
MDKIPDCRLIGARGRGSSNDNVHEDRQMQFMPMPMVAGETQTGMLRSRPAATLVDELQDIDEAESSRLRVKRHDITDL